MNALSHVERGRQAETIAAFLVLRGYRILDRNWRYSRLEIDLVAAKANLLAVVEVKYRDRPRLGGAPAAVTPAKQRDIETATVGYLRVKGLSGLCVRFDVVTIEPAPGAETSLVVKHLPGAFPATGRYRA
jgi:putative endonuclease